MTNVDLQGKSIVITGASMGIGESAAHVCLEAGARVTIAARGAQALDASARRFIDKGYGDRVVTATADVSRREDVVRLLDFAHERFGRVDGVIHAAAIVEPAGTILDVDPEAWLRTIEIDLYGAFLVTREACAVMRSRGGRIVLFSGGGASAPFPGFTAYACSKVAVVRFAETVAQEVRALGIEINALGPGLVMTRMLATVRRASSTDPSSAPAAVEPEIGARAAAFLVSDAARGITGKFVSAVHDDYTRWPLHLDELQSTDAFTLRRILPRDRGMDWR